ncbi:MAG: hypothetical protein Q8R02_04230 [Hyphomonadaceae bacterium]|nr:hypothetical protein [Hyphomonadaceae bacterium]
MTVQTNFTWEFSTSEAAANARALNRTLYGNARATYAAVLIASFVVVLGITLTGVYLGWWGDFSSAALIVGVGLAFLLSRFVASRLRRRLAKRARGGHEIEGRRVDYTFGEDEAGGRRPRPSTDGPLRGPAQDEGSLSRIADVS